MRTNLVMAKMMVSRLDGLSLSSDVQEPVWRLRHGSRHKRHIVAVTVMVLSNLPLTQQALIGLGMQPEQLHLSLFIIVIDIG